jgi:hypothetical protein
MKVSVASFDPAALQIFATLGNSLLASIARESKHSAIERQFNFRGVDTWEVDVEFEAIRVFMDIDRRYPRGCCRAAVVLACVAEQTVNFLLQARHHAPGILSHHSTHGTTPSRLLNIV